MNPMKSQSLEYTVFRGTEGAKYIFLVQLSTLLTLLLTFKNNMAKIILSRSGAGWMAGWVGGWIN